MLELFANPGFATGLAVGVVSTILGLVVALIVAVFLLSSRGGMYDLDHWKLNLRTPLPSMWMNLGYWKSPDGKAINNFDEACASLLREVLTTARLLNSSTEKSSVTILDLGIGCGDQTRHLIRLYGSRRLRYVGLTLNRAQLQTAARRLEEVKEAQYGANSKVDLFCADAAKPRTWTDEVRSAIEGLGDEKFAGAKWLLALDCLYHFSPSRKPILSFAARKLGANFAAFDLILNKSSSWSTILLARTVGVLMGCPWKTFLTKDEYRDQLLASGYQKGSVVIRDVSEDVFPGLVGFLDRQDQALAGHGISLGGGFRLARKVFGWFASAKVIRAVIVVAHASQNGSKSSTMKIAAG